MKILLVCAYKNLNNPYAFHLKNNFIKLNYQIKLFDYRYNTFFLGHGKKISLKFNSLLKLGIKYTNALLKKSILKFKPDIILVRKGEYILNETINWARNKLGIYTILSFPDDPQLFSSISSKIAPSYDYVFTNSIATISLYKKIGIKNVSFLPFGIDPTIYKRIKLQNSEKKYFGSDITFVGTYSKKREQLMNVLKDYNLKIWGSKWMNVSSELREKCMFRSVNLIEMVKIYNASKIVLNNHVSRHQINQKDFEITGCGAFLLSDYTKDLEKIFKIGKEIVCFKNIDEVPDLVEYYLKNNKKRKEIAIMGQNKTYSNYTIKNEIEKYIEVYKKYH